VPVNVSAVVGVHVASSWSNNRAARHREAGAINSAPVMDIVGDHQRPPSEYIPDNTTSKGSSRSGSTAPTYHADGASTSWLKIKNPAYSQAEGRAELFEQHRISDRPRATQKKRRVLVLA
jgi:hypothetical protein